jgi:integrase
VLEREEVEKILAGAEPPHYEPLVFLAETGARVGEAKWLTWDDVDFQRRLIHIRPKDGWKPKSGDERVVPMSDGLYDLLQVAAEKKRRRGCSQPG